MSATETDPLPADEIRSFLERFEAVQVHVDEHKADQKEILKEAKSRGYSVKVLRRLIRDRKRSKAEVQEEEAALDLYRQALGEA